MQYLAQIISKLIAYFIIYIMIGLMLEKAWHWEETVEQLARRLKHSTVAVLKIIFTKEKNRHIFDIALYEDIQEVIKGYQHNGFYLENQVGMKDNVPYYGIAFVPNETFEKDKLQEITNLVYLKFCDYMGVYDLTFHSYPGYHFFKGKIYILIYFSEFPEDEIPFKIRYQRLVARASNKNYGILRDTELDKELNLVD